MAEHTLGGRYELHERIGAGGMGAVYRAPPAASDRMYTVYCRSRNNCTLRTKPLREIKLPTAETTNRAPNCENNQKAKLFANTSNMLSYLPAKTTDPLEHHTFRALSVCPPNQ